MSLTREIDNNLMDRSREIRHLAEKRQNSFWNRIPSVSLRNTIKAKKELQIAEKLKAMGCLLYDTALTYEDLLDDIADVNLEDLEALRGIIDRKVEPTKNAEEKEYEGHTILKGLRFVNRYTNRPDYTSDIKNAEGMFQKVFGEMVPSYRATIEGDMGPVVFSYNGLRMDELEKSGGAIVLRHGVPYEKE